MKFEERRFVLIIRIRTSLCCFSITKTEKKRKREETNADVKRNSCFVPSYSTHLHVILMNTAQWERRARQHRGQQEKEMGKEKGGRAAQLRSTVGIPSPCASPPPQ